MTKTNLVSAAKPNSSLLRGSLTVSALTLLSRALGFFRDLLIARGLGAGLLSDVFFVAFRAPNLLRSFVAEGALSSAFIPTFSSEKERGDKHAQLAFRSALSLSLLCTSALFLLMFIFSDEIIALLAPGFQGDSSALKNSSMLLKIMSPIIIFISLVALSNGALSCYRIYGKAALAQVVMNISMIAGASFALFTTPENGIILLAVSVTIGAIFQIFVQIPSLRKLEFSILPSLRLFTKSNKEILVLIFPALFGAAIYQMTIVLGTIFASLLPRGSISALFYADRIAQLPLGLISIAVASVLLPILANAESKKDWSATKNELSKSIRFVNFLILPISFYFFMYAQPIVSLLFERGAFTSQDALITSQALQAYCFGLWAVSTHSLLTRVFLAKKDTKTPAIIGLGSLLFYLCSCLLLMGPPSYLEESVFLDSFLLPVQAALSSQFGSLSLGHVGLALSNSITACFSVVLSLLVFYFRSFELDLRPVIRLILSSLVACLAARYVVSVLPSTQPTFIYLSLSAIVFSLVYLVLMLIIRSPEARDLIRIPSIYLHKKLSRGISEK